MQIEKGVSKHEEEKKGEWKDPGRVTFVSK